MRRFAAPLTVLALLVALCGAPRVHVHPAEEDEHHELHGALLHAHAGLLTLHHHDDGAEISDNDDHHAARYLDLFQATIAAGHAFAFTITPCAAVEPPVIARIARDLPDFGGHDPPFHPRLSNRGPPA